MITSFVDEGLGNSSYLVDLGDGGALAVDPVRDPTGYLAEAERRNLTVRFSVETHLHADFISGGRDLAALGAELVAPKGAGLAYTHRGVEDAEELDVGGLTLRAIATPGHTPEHLSYLLLDGNRPLALFSGGAVIVGSIARTDLVSPDLTDALARQAYRAVRGRFAYLPDDLPVYPTHGGGSFCSVAASGERTTTIGWERRSNPIFTVRDEDSFVTSFLGSLGSYPPYFLRTRALNQRGLPTGAHLRRI
ncbi:MAG: MBL fold metallo-hydrolase, partial [Actinomycetota bacterium]